MQTLFPQHPSAQPRRKRLVRLVLLVLLLVASATLGAMGGLLIVYSVDLPQVEELERYRPSSVTELYDDQQRVIGSFALQRR
ncbi:MAG TPA: penicillin-binding protein, partial [Terriglobales bacterium]|nr:penicillin-binding protein [Terriglobales bacterium]